MTFLEFVCQKLMGPPTYRSGGRSIWPCPECGDLTAFGTLPHRPEFKDRVYCHRCRFRGDACDLLKEFYPDEKYPQQLNRLDAMRIDYDRQNPAESVDILCRGPGSIQQRVAPRNERRDLDAAWAAFMDDLEDWELGQPFGLGLLTQFKERCEKNNVSMEALLKYWQEFEDWIADGNERHLAECDDEQCDTIICRAMRGLPPLTKAEIQLEREAANKAKQERMERARKAINKHSVKGPATRAQKPTKGTSPKPLPARRTRPKPSKRAGKLRT